MSMDRERLGPILRALQVGACVALFVALSAWEARGESATYDEGPHLSAAYTALMLGDYRLAAEQPPLGRRFGALALLGEPVRIPVQHPAWASAEHFAFGFAFLFASGNDGERLLRRARWAMLSWGVLLLLSVYAVARRLFGHGGGMLALLAAALDPNLLAHAHLVTTDVPVAALVFLAVAAFHRMLEAPHPARVAAAGVLAGGAIATKLSALALGPVFAALVLVRWGRAVRAGRGPGGGAPAAPPATPGRDLLRLAAVAAIAWAVVWAAYGFRFAASPDPAYVAAQHLQFGPQGLRGLLGWAADHRLAPEAFLVALAELRNHSAAGHWGFALGAYALHGWWWYLPFTALVKNPVSWLALLALGCAVWWRRGGTGGWGATIAAAGLLVAAIAMTSPLAMGVRHLLPAFPFAFVACGAAWASWRGWVPRAAGALAALLAVECLAESPHHLAYFNAATVAMTPRERVLLDSNLDWGQDLARLRDAMAARGIARVKLAYFGMASPRQLGLDHEILLSGMSLYPRFEPEWREARSIEPGDWVAVSAFCLDRLRPDLRPDPADRVAVVGRSIFLFHVSREPREPRP